MCDKKKVYSLYFLEKRTCTEIAKEMGVTKQAVSKILKQFPEYTEEKERKKQENKNKHIQETSEYMKRKRIKQKEEEESLIAGMMELQKQNAMSMSKKRTLSDDTLVESCINHYRYDPKHEKIVFVEDFGRKPADLPKSMNVHKTFLNRLDEYAQNIESEKWISSTEEKALR
ncbi:terminase [Thermoanaerobacterium thermosaccharolyticum]|uniref:Terminase n=1 Tax=Thermoanaerobacterium thermosaccharolyticum TaxID=1517 RepID=A0A223HZ15_THETR|nr:helix-turn-helix domain-containing protein [Thermoanaerobacterium thermosaccharolyticum]AST57709.1 terminase [Thermoanaerobacterium thermosaccharolyticum]